MALEYKSVGILSKPTLSQSNSASTVYLGSSFVLLAAEPEWWTELSTEKSENGVELIPLLKGGIENGIDGSCSVSLLQKPFQSIDSEVGLLVVLL